MSSFERDPLSALDLYRGDFLEGFYVKDDEDLTSGLLQTRCEEALCRKLLSKIEQVGFADLSIELFAPSFGRATNLERKTTSSWYIIASIIS